MDTIKLYSSSASDATTISNIFIDTYMPVANGSYVKVYLYLLRCLSGKNSGLSISYLADRLDNTEKDIVRALNYWEKVQLISVSRNTEGNITGITMNEPSSTQTDTNTESTEILDELAISQEEVPTSLEAPIERPVYTSQQIAELSNNDEIKWIMNIIEIYLERLLKPKDVQLILYLYDTVGFSAELIMYLYEYCISKNKKNASYIETVALSWAVEGIDSVEKAEASTTMYNSNYNAVNKAFGLTRAPGNIEKQYINKWLNSFGFDIAIIVEACNRTLLNTQKPDFKYADKILENWHKKGVKSPSDIEKLDQEYSAVKASVKPQHTPGVQAKQSNNKFNAFPQRTYSAEDYSSLEQRLLHK